jgi:ATP/ADP translocase
MPKGRKRNNETSETDGEPGKPKASLHHQPELDDDAMDAVDDMDDAMDDPHVGLLRGKSKRGWGFRSLQNENPNEWQRPVWLGGSLFLILFAFWMLDSLKEPILGDLVNGNLKRHQPIAKLVSVATTLGLVAFLEFLSNNARQQQQQQQQQRETANESVLAEGGTWTRMGFNDDPERPEVLNASAQSTSSLVYILISYAMAFAVIARILQLRLPSQEQQQQQEENSILMIVDDDGFTAWHLVGYFIFATIESFGSLAVASFWSFTNTTLSLEDAARYYGPIVAFAQLGAIGGSTMVTTGYYSTPTLFLLSCLTILLHLVVMNLYTHRFRPSNLQALQEEPLVLPFANNDRGIQTLRSATTKTTTTTITTTSNEESGIHLILRHNYVLLLLGVSCLFEVSLTCLDYQFKLIGFMRFENSSHAAEHGRTFTEFMGFYGQMVNVTSLFFSLFAFPLLMRRFGLRYTLWLFPTLLVLATVVAFGALPGNLYVLFISMSMLKAMTYSIHDPSKELLYLPTCNAIKYKAKFWIDIVGARVAKAIGSSINSYAGSAARSVSVGSYPSLLTALLLWAACYYAGHEFDHLIATGTVVGATDGKRFHRAPAEEADNDNDNDIHSGIYMVDHGGDDDDDEDRLDSDPNSSEAEAVFVSESSPEKATAHSSIELRELSSAIRSNDSSSRRGSV